MAIIFDESREIFRLLTANSEYQMKVDDIGVLLHNYYGRPSCDTDMSYQILSVDRGFSGNLFENRANRGRSIDVLPQEYSGCGVGDYRISSINVTAKNGSRSCDLRYKSYEIIEGKQPIAGLPSVREYDDDVSTLIITMEDQVIGLEVQLFYSVFTDKDVITRHTRFINVSDKKLQLEKAASAMLDVQFGSWDEIHFSGRHCMERQMSRNKLTQDIKVISSKRGMSSHHENPFVILCDHGATETYGDCYGMMLMYSGNHKIEIEQDQAGSTRIVAGINDENFSWCLEAGESFDTPEAIMAYTSEGLEKLSHIYHNIIRENVCDRKYMDVNIIEFYRLKEYQNQMLKHTKHIDITNINFVDFFGYHKEAGLDIISVAVGVVCYNYMKNGNNEIISGSDSAKQTEVVLLSFARKSGAKTIKSINEFEEGQDVCPNCGAKITSITNVCEHCGTALYNSTSNWIINHMEVL